MTVKELRDHLKILYPEYEVEIHCRNCDGQHHDPIARPPQFMPEVGVVLITSAEREE